MGEVNRSEGRKTMNDTYEQTINERQQKDKEAILEYLGKVPIIQIACERSGVSRATYYRWRKEDPEFLKASDIAIAEGELLINDLSESQVITLIKDKNWSAISFWLRHHHDKYAERIKVDANVQTTDEHLTPEQEKIVRKAIAFISSPNATNSATAN